MFDLTSFLDFAFDIVCMLPPLDAPHSITVTQDQAMYCAFGSVALLALSLVMSGAKELDPKMGVIAGVAAVGSLIIGFVSQPELMKSIFITAYPPMVICFRFGELSLAGAGISKKLSLPFVIALVVLFIIVVVVAYYLLSPLPAEQISHAKTGWAVFGAIVAAITWTRMMSGSDFAPGLFGGVAFFGVFLSTLIYVLACSPDSIERFLFQWSLPCGFLVGVIVGRFEKHTESKSPDVEHLPEEEA